MTSKIYVGVCKNNRVVFKSETVPTQQSHGSKYVAAIGPFRTMRAATLMAVCGSGNPHLQNVSDAERIAARQSN